jgi:molecular chaperone GrpE (heat shock protein)
MLEMEKHDSEVARLLARFRAEYEAAQWGLSGLAFGTSQHKFITAKMENMWKVHAELHDLVGDTAMAMIAEDLNQVSDNLEYPQC